MKLAVSYSDNEVQIVFDREGLDHLLLALTRLQKSKAPEHDHLMSEAWGGWELTTDEARDNIAHHLRLQLVGSEGGRDEVSSVDTE